MVNPDITKGSFGAASLMLFWALSPRGQLHRQCFFLSHYRHSFFIQWPPGAFASLFTDSAGAEQSETAEGGRQYAAHRTAHRYYSGPRMIRAPSPHANVY